MGSEYHLSRRGLLRRTAGLLALGAAGGLSSVWNEQAEAQAPVRGGVLKVANIGDPPTLDAHQTTAIVTEATTQEIYESLFALDADWEPQPLLATDFHWSDGNLKLTLPLRADVVFHNGAPLQAADVVASVQRWIRLSALGQLIKQRVKSVTAKDDHTVVFELTEPAGSLLADLANPNNMPAIMPKSLIDQYGDKPITAPVGTGPYRLQEWKPDSHLRVVRFDRYRPVNAPASGYAGRRVPYLDAIEFIPVPESNTRVAGMQSGQYDFAVQVPADQYPQIKANATLVPEIVKPYGWPIFVFNKTKGAFANQKMRQAFLKALDNRPIMQAAIGPKEFWTFDSPTIAYGAFTDNTAGANTYNHQDVADAKALLKESGYDGKPILFLTTQNYDLMYNSAVVAKGQLEAAGFKVDLQVVDWATLVQRRNNPDLYDVFTTFVANVPADPVAMNPWISNKWPGWWVSEKKEAALREFSESVSLDKRKAAWSKLQTLVYEEVPAIKLGDFFLLNVAQQWVKGFQSTPNLFFWNVWLAKR